MSLDPTVAFAGMPERTPEEAAAREAAMRAAYGSLFGTELGRQVLADILAEAGVGRLMGAQSVNREYEAGAHDLALKIMDRACFSTADLHANLTQPEEGYFHDRSELD